MQKGSQLTVRPTRFASRNSMVHAADISDGIGLPSIAPGAVLIRTAADWPPALVKASPRGSGRWVFVADSSGIHQVENQPPASGISCPAGGTIRRAATGADSRTMIRAALERVLAAARLEDCNFLEIEEVRMHSFRTIRYASVSGHACHLHSHTEGKRR